jgi:hypothetical protein
MGRVFKLTLKEPGQHYWQRHDADDPDPITVIFRAAMPVVDDDGLKIADGKPMAWLAKDDVLGIAPGRADLDPSLWVDNSDTLLISGKLYGVESCSFDGCSMCEIELIRKRT